MAGDWIKWTIGLEDKEEIDFLARRHKLTRYDAAGRCMALWAWYDQHTENGHARRVTSSFLDERIGVTGFVASLVEVGWLTASDEGGVSVHHWDRHNGQTGKARALARNRKVTQRSRKCHDASVTAKRQEKRRDDIKPPISPKGDDDVSFDTFWTAYPLKRGKAEALKVWKRDKLAGKLDEILAALEAHKRLPQWQKDNGQYIPHASTWLNNKRYEDELESDVPGLYGQAWADQPYKAG